MGTKTILAVASASLLAASPFLHLGKKALWIPFWPASKQTVYESSTCAWTGPECPSFEDLHALTDALVNEGPVPPGFTRSRHVAHEIARTTGAIDWLGRHEIQVTVREGAEELDSVRLYLDDDLMSEATRVNGTIVECADEAEATLSFFLPWLPPFTVKLVMQGSDGRDEESSITIGRVSRPSR
jgi:hypothetical protein